MTRQRVLSRGSRNKGIGSRPDERYVAAGGCKHNRVQSSVEAMVGQSYMNFLKSWTPLKRRGGRRAAKVGDRDSNQRCHHNKRRKKGQGERRARAVGGQVAAQIVAGQEEPAAGGAGGRADVEEEQGALVLDCWQRLRGAAY